MYTDAVVWRLRSKLGVISFSVREYYLFNKGTADILIVTSHTKIII
jgi:hypothetical protein